MARLEVYLPGDGSFGAEMSDEKLVELAKHIGKNFKEEGGSWMTIEPHSSEATTTSQVHHRWVPSSAGLAFFWDDWEPGAAEDLPNLSLVI